MKYDDILDTGTPVVGDYVDRTPCIFAGDITLTVFKLCPAAKNAEDVH